MITKEVSRLVYNCYSEIESGEKMIDELKKSINKKGEFELKDNWNDSRHLELRIPTGGASSYSIKQVPFDVALQTIKSHIKNQKKELTRLRTICLTQLS